MIKQIIDKLRGYKKQLQSIKNDIKSAEEDSKIKKEDKHYNITVSKQDNIYKVVVSDYITINDYLDELEIIDKDVINLISNNILWNSDLGRVNKGVFYVTFNENKLYNILVSENKIEVDQRTKIGDKTEERIININLNNNIYYYSSFKHDEIGSTYYHKFYNNDVTSMKLGELEFSKEEASFEIKNILSDLEQLECIENIIVLDMFKKLILDDLSEGSFKKLK